MAVFLVLLFPLLLLVFAVLMERVEARLQNGSVTENEVEEFLDQARPEEVNTFIREGWPGVVPVPAAPPAAAFAAPEERRGRRTLTPAVAAPRS